MNDDRRVLVPWWWLIVMPLLAGFGLVWIFELVVPDVAQTWLVMAGAAIGAVWALRQARWARNMQRKVATDAEEFRKMTEGER